MQDLALLVFDVLLMILDLLSPEVVHLNHGLVHLAIVVPLEAPVLVFLADKLLRGLAKHTLLRTVVFKRILVRSSLLCSCSEDAVTITLSGVLLKILLLLFESHGGAELVTVGLGGYLVVDCLNLLITLVCLSLALDHSTPLVQVASGVGWVVSLVVFCKGLQFLAFIFHWLLHTLGVDLQRVNQVVHFICFSTYVLSVNYIQINTRSVSD